MRQNESWWCISQEVKDRVKDQEDKGKGETGMLKDRSVWPVGSVACLKALQRQMEAAMGERMEVEAKIEKKKSHFGRKGHPWWAIEASWKAFKGRAATKKRQRKRGVSSLRWPSLSKKRHLACHLSRELGLRAAEE